MTKMKQMLIRAVKKRTLWELQVRERVQPPVDVNRFLVELSLTYLFILGIR